MSRLAPDYRLSLQGQVMSPALRGRLERLQLTDRRGLEADQLELTLTDHDNRLALPPRGAKIELALGWQGQALIERGTFIVDEVEHAGSPDVLNIRARSADMRGSLPGKRTQSWHKLTLGDIVTTIAKRHDLETKLGTGMAGIRVSHIDQTDESDLNFLTRLGERFDAVATVKAGNLLFIPAGQATTAGGLAIPPIQLRRDAGDRHRYVVTDRDSYSGVIAYWNDVSGAQRKQVIAGSGDTAKRLRPTYASQEDALTAAKAEWQRLQRGQAEFELILARGRPDLYPETPAWLIGWKREIEETPWIITEVVHTLDDNAYTGRVQFEIRDTNEKAPD